MLVDDHRIVREGLRALLKDETGFQLVGEAADGPEAIRVAERLRPDVLVLDLMLPGLKGLDVAREVTRRSPHTRIVMLSMHGDEPYVAEAIRAGAVGYVLKEAGAAELLRAMREAVAGRRFYSGPISEERVQSYLRQAQQEEMDPYHRLTLREREVLQMTVEGHSSAEVARKLFISSRTVESHRANLMRKLGLRNQKEVVRYATERGLLSAREETKTPPER
jgi:DNA-binding NarL/FixJ family response regulator